MHPGHSPEPQLVVLTSSGHVDGASDPPKKPYNVQSCKGNDSPSVRPKTVATSPLVAAAHIFIWFPLLDDYQLSGYLPLTELTIMYCTIPAL